MSHPIFEQTTSALVHSNDGHLQVVKASHDPLPSTAWEVVDLREPAGERTVLRTYSRVLADAYIAGYDESERHREARERGLHFVLDIKLGNAAMETRGDVAEALIKLGQLIREVDAESEFSPAHVGLDFNIRDLNGNTVGSWKVVKV